MKQQIYYTGVLSYTSEESEGYLAPFALPTTGDYQRRQLPRQENYASVYESQLYGMASAGQETSSEWVLVETGNIATIDKIRGFLRLPSGWHHGEGVAPSAEVVRHAISINSIAKNHGLLTDAVPGLAGEIQVAIYGPEEKKTRYIEMTIGSDFSINVTKYEKTTGRWEITQDFDFASIQEAKPFIARFRSESDQCRALFESYQKDTITENSNGFQVKPSRTIKVQYRSYKNYAFQS